ncbi:hypothetical protein BDN72DRAFT_839351 [Pluteus cervinus]|uniref:Uncharacterized protein n=1 Tax=Pluteus cervinus TaxID=181527 RepID=A0ACD3AX11_9AGAR|nr:hypothetical protein BDN72DRAFT_839351 [Pluteus cervinus]
MYLTRPLSMSGYLTRSYNDAGLDLGHSCLYKPSPGMSSRSSPFFMSVTTVNSKDSEPSSIGKTDDLEATRFAIQQHRLRAVERAWKVVAVWGAVGIVYITCVLFGFPEPLPADRALLLDNLTYFWIFPALASVGTWLVRWFYMYSEGFNIYVSIWSSIMGTILNGMLFIVALSSFYGSAGHDSAYPRLRMLHLLGLGPFIASCYLAAAHSRYLAVLSPSERRAHTDGDDGVGLY